MAPANKSTQSLSFSHLTRRDHLSTFFWPHLYITQFKGNTLPVPAGTSSIISYTPKLNLVSPLSPVPLTPDYSTLFIQRNVPKSSGRCLAERSRQARLRSTHGLNSRLQAKPFGADVALGRGLFLNKPLALGPLAHLRSTIVWEGVSLLHRGELHTSPTTFEFVTVNTRASTLEKAFREERGEIR